MTASATRIVPLLAGCLVLAACSTSYEARPVSFQAPSAYGNVVEVAGTQIGSRAYVTRRAAQEAFGFDIRGAGILPVEVVFDNAGEQQLVIDPAQTFLEDDEGNLWPVLADRFAYERVTRYAQTEKIFKEGAYGGFLGATAGAIVGAAVGVIDGGSVSGRAGEGAVAGAAAGAVLGGLGGAAGASEARNRLMEDFNDKSLKNQRIEPGQLAYGFIFFPGEAQSARLLRLTLKVPEDDATIPLRMPL